MRTPSRFWGCCALLMASGTPLMAEGPANPALLAQHFLFDPMPTKSCHASTIVDTPTGLVASWFGGEYERHPSVGIWVSRLEGGKWTTPVEVADGVQADGKRLPSWNPVLYQPKGKPLHLFYKVGPSPSRWWGMLKTSGDGGKTWSEATKLPDGILGPIKDKPVLLSDGVLLCPASTETPEKKSRWLIHFERTPDLGKTWEKVAPPQPDEPRVDAIQPCVLFHADGSLQALARTQSDWIYDTWSRDNGKTWSPLKKTSLPNPDSGIDAVTLRDGRHLLIYNPTPNARTPLSLAISRDGKEWKNVLTLETDPGEYSYPAIIQGEDGRVHMTYTWKREQIRYAAVDPDKLPSP